MLSVPNFGLWYDFRHPANQTTSQEQTYRENLEQIRHAETLGFDSVWLTEHHFQDDGYSPSPLVIAAAIGAATSRLQIGTNLALLPLYNPVRLAEDAATLSLLTGGRFDLGVGAGFMEREYAVFGRELKHRPSLMEEGIAIIRQAWSGQPVSLSGKRFQIENLPVTPAPEQLPRLLLGAIAAPAIERAARLADGYLDSGGIGRDIYLQSLEAVGKPSDQGAIFAGCWDIVCEDPELARRELGPCLLHQMRSYQSMGSFADICLETPDQAIENGFYRFLSPEEMVAALSLQIQDYPQTRDIHFWGRFPGGSGNLRTEAHGAFGQRGVAPCSTKYNGGTAGTINRPNELGPYGIRANFMKPGQTGRSVVACLRRAGGGHRAFPLSMLGEPRIQVGTVQLPGIMALVRRGYRAFLGGYRHLLPGLCAGRNRARFVESQHARDGMVSRHRIELRRLPAGPG